MLSTRVQAGAELFPLLKPAWQALAERDRSATPFQTWEWQSTWWKHYGGAKKPLALTLYEGDDLVGLMAFTRSSGPWRTLRSMGIGPSDYLHPITAPGFEQAMAEAIREFVSEAKDLDLIDLHQVRETQALASAGEPDTRYKQASCLVLDLPATYEEYLKLLGKSLRYDVRKLDKGLFQSGKAQIEQATPDTVQAFFDLFLQMHRARWRQRFMPGAFVGRTVPFHREWIDQAVRSGWLRMGLLKLDDQPVGAIYAMRFGETLYYYQSGFDPDQGSISPGTLLVANTIRSAIDEGAKHFDFMRGDEGYKRRWKPQHAWQNQRILLGCGGLRGRIGASWNETAARVEQRMRTRLERGGSLLAHG